MTTEKSPLTYIREQMAGFPGFIQDWKNLTAEDKETLKEWAEQEMDA